MAMRQMAEAVSPEMKHSGWMKAISPFIHTYRWLSMAKLESLCRVISAMTSREVTYSTVMSANSNGEVCPRLIYPRTKPEALSSVILSSER